MSQLLHFDEVAVGDRWVSPQRVVSEGDVLSFAAMTGDYNPLHVDATFAAQTPFGKPIAHGLLGLSLLAGLSSEHPLMATAAFLGMRHWQFTRPIYFGDTVHVVTEIIEKHAHNRRRGEIVWRRELVNQHGQVVQTGEFQTLVEVARRAQERAKESVETEAAAPAPTFPPSPLVAAVS
jgi:acyl dehydratase